MGPFIVTAKNDVTNIYKLVSVGGEPYPSWVHVDRLKEVRADSIDTPWYNPTVSRAAWRAGVGLPAPTDDSVVVPSAPLSFSTARAPLPAGSARTQVPANDSGPK
ncbi:hypothetical protein G6F70_009636 [Rhizopus microsporus]|nr:hypothetical protein G6F70_009636 [Rhizopus microsporus]